MDTPLLTLLLMLLGFIFFGGYQSYQLALKHRKSLSKFTLIGITISVAIIIVNFAFFLIMDIAIIDYFFYLDMQSDNIRNYLMLYLTLLFIGGTGIVVLRYFRRKLKKHDACIIESIDLEVNN
ncbi:MAG: hypothetical protein PSV16_03350 [Flavobacterium sp.]|nr:hypothetical protein [Flavobacterium sp.]